MPDTAPDPDADTLRDHVERLSATVDGALEHLQAAADATSTTPRRSEAERALGLLLEDAGTASAGTEPLFPSESPERELIGDRSDLLGTLLADARDVGGARGTAVADLLRDEVAGDLGAWERDAAGVVASAERAATGPGAGAADLDRLTERILELPGEATRALAWTFVAVDTDDHALGTGAAQRAVAHLQFVQVAIEELHDVAATPASLDGDAP